MNRLEDEEVMKVCRSKDNGSKLGQNTKKLLTRHFRLNIRTPDEMSVAYAVPSEKRVSDLQRASSNVKSFAYRAKAKIA